MPPQAAPRGHKRRRRPLATPPKSPAEPPVHRARTGSASGGRGRGRRDQGWLASLMRALGLLIMLIAVSEVQPGAADLRLEEPIFQGYDCSDPWRIQEYASRPPIKCPSRPDTVTKSDTRVYQLLQKEERSMIRAIRCSRRTTSYEYYCGSADHATPSGTTSRYYSANPLDKWTCHQIATGDHMYRPRSTTPREYQKALEFHVPANKLVEARYFKAGYEWREWNINAWTLSCANSHHVWNNTGTVHMVSHQDDQISWQEIELEWDRFNNSLVDVDQRMPLEGCSGHSGWCKGGQYTYLFEDPKSDAQVACPLAVMRESQANVYTKTDAANVTQYLVSHVEDEGHFYIKLTGKTHLCSRLLFGTNDPDIFVLPLAQDDNDSVAWGEPIQRQLPPSHHSLHTFVTSQGNYLYWSLSGQASKEFDILRQVECENIKRRTRTELYLEQHVPGLNAALMRNGTFLYRSGEVSYLYSCTPVQLYAVNTDRCYNKLPVTPVINSSATDQTQGNGTDAEGRPTLFLTPESRILSPLAVKEPCTNLLISKYQAIGGQWYSVNPTILPSLPPSPVPINVRKPLPVFRPEDLTTGGVYLKKNMNGLQRRLFFRSIKEMVEAKIARNTSPADLRPEDDVPITIFTLFKDAKETIEAITVSAFKKAMGWIYDMGIYASAILSVYYAYAICKWIFQAVSGMFLQYQANGLGFHLLWGLPMLTHTFMARFYRNHRRRRQRENARNAALYEAGLSSDSEDDGQHPPPAPPPRPLHTMGRRATPSAPPPTINEEDPEGYLTMRPVTIANSAAASRPQGSASDRPRPITACSTTTTVTTVGETRAPTAPATKTTATAAAASPVVPRLASPASAATGIHAYRNRMYPGIPPSTLAEETTGEVLRSMNLLPSNDVSQTPDAQTPASADPGIRVPKGQTG